jgi:hypothetical protein
MAIKIFKSKDQNNITLYGAIVNDVIISTIYTSKIELKNRIKQVQEMILNNNYSNFLKY